MALRLWTGLLAAGLVLVLPSVKCIVPKAPVLIGCVFIHRANITCKWKPGDSQATNYTLHVEQMTVSSEQFHCHTPNTSCTVKIGTVSVNFEFCINVTAHSLHGNATSEPRCQHGTKEILLHPVELNNITSVHAKPQCLSFTWQKNSREFLISTDGIRNGKLESQIMFKEDGQQKESLRNVTVTSCHFEACFFRPDTKYTVNLRHRSKSGSSLWSPWSNDYKGRTAEDAPSSAPMFWRRVIHQDKHRLTSLLWKPLPHALANGKVRYYNVTCQDENADVLQDKGNCSNLNVSHTSCVLKLPLGPCSCSINASTSVGTSPKASIWLSKANEKERPPPRLLLVTAVDNRSLGLEWSRPSTAAVSPSGFVVEWFVVTQNSNTPLHWEKVNNTTTALTITEGLEPFQRYAVSVTALYGKEGTGQSQTEFVYTLQGVPSAGPVLHVQTSGCTVTLNWSLPVEKLHGFIRNYTLFYGTANQRSKVVLPGTEERHTLLLSPGHYEFWMQASTEAGAGAMGPAFSANIAPEEISVVLCVLIPIGLISLLLILIACVAQSKIVKGNLCQEIPDPSHSSMATWSPKSVTGMMYNRPDITFSGAVLLSDVEAETYESDEDKDLQTCPCPATPTQRYNPFKHETEYQKCAAISNMTDTSSSSFPVIYTVALVANAEPMASSSSGQQDHSRPDVKRYGQPQEGDGERCPFNVKGSDVTFYQTKHPDVACPSSCVAPQLHRFNLDSFASTSMLEPEAFAQMEWMQNTSFSCLPVPDSLLMDFMLLPQSSVECDPYLPV